MLLLEGIAMLILAALGAVYLTALCAQLRLGRRRRYFNLGEAFPPAQQWPLISVLVPAYNEERVISATVGSLLAADYPEVEIIVIDDGSSDRTADIVTTIAASDTRVKLIRQSHNSGKASALNAGVAQASSEYLVVIDADTVADPDFLKLIVAPLLTDEADAVAGNVKVGNKRHGLLLILQSMEYISALNTTRLLQGVSKAVTTIPGAAGAMSRAAIRSVGAYSASTQAEDADLTLRLVDSGYRTLYQPRAVVHTEAPATWHALFRQRLRWIFGNIQCIDRDRAAVLLAVRAGFFQGSTAFIYENLWKPPLEFLRASIPVVLVGSDIYLQILCGYVLVLALNGVVAALAYRMDQERWRELLYFPIYYVLWPIFSIVPYCVAAYCLFADRSVAWQKAARTGAVAMANRENRHGRANVAAEQTDASDPANLNRESHSAE